MAKLRLNLEYWGQCYPPPSVRLGRPPLLRQAQLDGLEEYLKGRPGAYLEEMQAYLYDEFDVECHISTVWRALEKLSFSRKLATKRAREQIEPLRRVYRARMQQYKAEQVIAIDESACNERTGDRKYGWSQVSTPVEATYSMKRSERWSLLPAMTVNGYLNYTIFQGSITSEIMEDCLARSVLPHTTPGYSVIVLDNASIHRSARLRELCAMYEVQLEYLPPYSPDYNPIEKSIKQLKIGSKGTNKSRSCLKTLPTSWSTLLNGFCERSTAEAGSGCVVTGRRDGVTRTGIIRLTTLTTLITFCNKVLRNPQKRFINAEKNSGDSQHIRPHSCSFSPFKNVRSWRIRFVGLWDCGKW